MNDEFVKVSTLQNVLNQNGYILFYTKRPVKS